MDEEDIKNYIRAGEIAARARDFAERSAKPGMKILELAEMVEEKIIEMGGKPAFPCNISINWEAAHRTPVIGDELVIPEDSVVKIDIGAHVDGYIADTATTVSFNPRYLSLVDAVRDALEKALHVVSAGVKFSEVGRIVEDTLNARGFKPIKNLSGHSLGRFIIHAGESIPNYYERISLSRFKSNRAYAIEPFGTDGKGFVVESGIVTIHALWKTGKVKGLTHDEKKLYTTIRERFKTLPFTERWLSDVFENDTEKLRATLGKLAKKKILYGYPILVEAGKGMVAQFEHTILILDKEVIVTTKLK